MNSDINFKPQLLSKSELYWLLGDIKVSKSFEYKMKSNIKRKVQTLTELELPLLVKNSFLSDNYDKVNDNLGRDLQPQQVLCHYHLNQSCLGKAEVPGPNPGQGFLVLA
jgi:hypothetical protein